MLKELMSFMKKGNRSEYWMKVNYIERSTEITEQHFLGGLGTSLGNIQPGNIFSIQQNQMSQRSF